MYYGYDWRSWANIPTILAVGRLGGLWWLVQALRRLKCNKSAGNGDAVREGATFSDWLHRELGVYIIISDSRCHST